MPGIFKPTFTRPLPTGATRIDRALRIGEVPVPCAEWVDPSTGETHFAPLTADGSRIVVETRNFYGRIRNPDGTFRVVKLCPGASDAKWMFAHLQPYRGDRVDGSQYLRDFCCDCGEPIRVRSLDDGRFCEKCDAVNPRIATSRRGVPVDKTPWNDGWAANCLKALEDTD